MSLKFKQRNNHLIFLTLGSSSLSLCPHWGRHLHWVTIDGTKTQYLRFSKFKINNLLYTGGSCSHTFSSVQFSDSVMSDSLQPHEPQHARPPCPPPTPGAYSNSLSTEPLMPFSHLSLCHPLLILPSIFPSMRVFSSESVLCIRWPKYWSFSFSISPSNGYSGLISFRMDWLDLLAVQRTLKSLLQYHRSKA